MLEKAKSHEKSIIAQNVQSREVLLRIVEDVQVTGEKCFVQPRSFNRNRKKWLDCTTQKSLHIGRYNTCRTLLSTQKHEKI